MISDKLAEAIVSNIHHHRTVILQGLLSVSAKAFIVSEIRKRLKKPIVVITDSNKTLEEWIKDLNFFEPDLTTAVIPSFETDIYSGASPHSETQEERALSLYRLANHQVSLALLSAKSLITRTPKPEKLLGIELKQDENYDLKNLIGTLIEFGYVREEPVYGVGQFSIRGGIVDIWSPNVSQPVRIEFFGDTVESIRTFDPETQLSVQHINTVSIAPMREFLFDETKLKELAQKIRENFSEERFERSLKDITDFADAGESFHGCEFLMPLVAPPQSDIFDYLPSDAIFIFDEPSAIEQMLSSYAEKLNERYRETLEADCICLPPETFFLNETELRNKLGQFKRIELRMLGKTATAFDENFKADESSHAFAYLFSDDLSSAPSIHLNSRPVQKFHNRINDFAKAIKESDSRKIIIANSDGMAQRIVEILRSYGIESLVRKNLEIEHAVTIVVGELSSGFELTDEKLLFQTESEIFDEPQTPPKPQKQKTSLNAFISDFRDLKPGDYVVHVDHGVGRFENLETIQVGDEQREFMALRYADNAKLLVPVERLDLVSRYGSAEGREPTLDKLGSINWQKTKARAKRAMREIADDLLKLYAERKLVKGYAFSEDTPWQKEFEDAFPFELTPDQASAIEAVKKDMEQEAPMDRLIVGDVGYGKTEVAMRAAFKAVMDGKQVVLLAPTTVLAYQHFETFKGRFAAFPVNIELLSRFRAKSEQKRILQDVEEGKVDILIGTHRLLSKDVKIPKLGLLIVDEEQRFGVVHKERLKKMKKSVDVLTLSATPIPRTLNMALLGLRDISIIETPPRDRLAINTQIVPFSENVIKSAIELELSRSGQVFFIHNRVETIEMIATKIQKIVPQARICVAHGQMNEKVIERTMLDFINYKYDVLVATTIIENGIDIPRANTIIINRADKYGLAQLYQLRGRVGRSNRRAYAYLLIPSEAELTPIARKRLAAIREFSDLGAGFRLAALDLELRGAGNLLGAEQSGHIEALGFELYMKMLERTVRELRGEEIEDELQISIDLGVSTSIPTEYISDTSQRLRAYKRIASANSEQELQRIREEISDRYGEIPEPVLNLLAYRRLAIFAEKLRIIAIEKARNGSIAIKFDKKTKASPERLIDLLNSNDNLKFSPNGILYVMPNGQNPIETTIEILKQLDGNSINDEFNNLRLSA